HGQPGERTHLYWSRPHVALCGLLAPHLIDTSLHAGRMSYRKLCKPIERFGAYRGRGRRSVCLVTSKFGALALVVLRADSTPRASGQPSPLPLEEGRFPVARLPRTH